ncbi:hypothetical protein [Rhizobium sp. 007]|uniref:hypothetical protein n=1 Tax=Rhizobium sp. 007 TaxID=2785056 RepID=UPI00188F719F|nr:hypothetical protein [Rhizobium sp. 007]QPB21121.1 hypothetical protein ISN39_06540 [Rhizobium sp. 007]
MSNETKLVAEQIEAFVDMMVAAEFSANVLFHHFTTRVVAADSDDAAYEIVAEFDARLARAVRERECAGQLVRLFSEHAAHRMGEIRCERQPLKS